MEREVKRERTGWRDLGLSERHRKWGWNVPAVDIDFYLEYDNGKPAGLIEYKAQTAPAVDPARDRNSQALVNLADAARIPQFGVRYARDFSWWIVSPLNARAQQWVPAAHQEMTEREYVAFLYRLRGYRDLPHTVRFDDKGRLQ
jgi:hypothetical protein